MHDALGEPGVPGRSLPIIVGATGGSGTRAVHRVLEMAGVYMGRRLNAAGDADDFIYYYDHHINPILSLTRSLDYDLDGLPASLRQSSTDQLGDLLRHHCRDVLPHSRWGLKNPRSMYLLPHIHRVLGDFFFVHVIRDGRDMALSRNQRQTALHHAALFGAPISDPIALSSMEMWAVANAQAADWAERTLGERYIRIRLEDLCAAPAAVLADTLARLSLDNVPTTLDRLASIVESQPTAGRWKRADPDVAAALNAIGAASLARFGYA